MKVDPRIDQAHAQGEKGSDGHVDGLDNRKLPKAEGNTSLSPIPASTANPAETSSSSPPNLGWFLKSEVAELLGLDPPEVPTTAPLNSLGFSSIDAVSLKSKLEQQFALKIQIATLNAYQSLAQLERALQGLWSKGSEPAAENREAATTPTTADPRLNGQPLLAPNQVDRYKPFHMNDIQESFYLGRKIGVADRIGAHLYFEITRADLDIYRLNAAWNRLVQHHEMLRAVMQPDGTQRILEETAPYRFRITDLRRQDPSAQAAGLARIREEMSHRLYGPEQWPLFEIRVTLLADRRVIHFSIDELLVDAMSLELIFRQWQRGYDQPELEWPPLDLSFRDYVLTVQRFASSPRAEADLEYWSHKLRQMPAGPLLPGFDPTPTARCNSPHRCTRLEGRLAASQWAALKRRAESLDASPTALVLGLFVEALRAHCPASPFSLILTFFNRLPLHPQVGQIVGPFISTSLFVAANSEPATLVDRVRQTQRQLWADLDHNSVSGIRVLRELKQRRNFACPPPLPVVFTSMLGARTETQETFRRDVTYSVTQTPQVYLDHQVCEYGGELHFSWDVVKAYFAPGLIDRLFGEYCRLLERAAIDPGFWEEATVSGICSPSLSLGGPATPRQAPATPPGGWGGVRGGPRGHGALSKSGPGRANDRPKYLLTEQQQAYAFGRSASGRPLPSNIYLEFESGTLDLERLEQAWHRVMASHSMLTTTIHLDGTQQALEEVPNYTIRVHDLTGLQEGPLGEALAKVEQEMTARMCLLGEWPFFELRTSRLPAGKMRLHLCVDMLIADPPSTDLLAQALFAAYADPAAVPTPTGFRFHDYARLVAETRSNQEQARALEYWNRKFADLPPGPALPAGAGIGDGRTDRLTATLDDWEPLKRKASELKVRPAIILLAAFAEVLAVRTDQEPFTIVVPCWKRLPVHSDVNRVVGDFTTLAWLPVRDWAGSFQEKVIRCQREVEADLAQSAVSGLRALRQRIRKTALAEGRPLRFPVVFTALSPYQPYRLPAGVRFLRSASRTAQVHLDHISTNYGNHLGLHWDVTQGAFAEGLIPEMFADYHRLLAGLATSEAWWSEAQVLPLIRGKAVGGNA